MLYAGAAYASINRFTGGSGTGLGIVPSARDRCQSPWIRMARTFGGTLKICSVPDGYRGGVATSLAIGNGGCAARLSGSSVFTDIDLRAIGVLTATPTGSGTVSFANLAGGVNIVCAATGYGSLTSTDMRAKAGLTCTINIGAQPTAEDIAQAVWNFILSGNTAPGNAAEKLKKTLTRDEFLGLS